jgi:Clp amino terminal domain, pathogenicity island component
VFERFTDRARRVLVLAQNEARLMNNGFVGTEHLLLGLIDEGEGLAARALRSFDISLEEVRERVEETIGPASRTQTSVEMPFTPRAKKVLELSLREALQLGHNYIGTEHILLGLVREGEGVAAQVLQSLGADLPKVRGVVISLLEGHVHPAVEEESVSANTARITRLVQEFDWPRYPTRVIPGPELSLSQDGIVFRVVGILFYENDIEVHWKLSGVPKPLLDLLQRDPNARFGGTRRVRDPIQRLITGPGGRRAMAMRDPGVPRRHGTPEGPQFLKVSVDANERYLLALGDSEPQASGDWAGRSYFVPEEANDDSASAARALTVEWQGQTIEVEL